MDVVTGRGIVASNPLLPGNVETRVGVKEYPEAIKEAGAPG